MPRALPVALFAAAAATMGASGCDPVPPSRVVFARDVVPVLEARCSAPACHGVSPDHEARGEVIDWQQLFYAVDDEGAIADVGQAYRAAKRVVDSSSPILSSFLRKPLAHLFGGTPHAGGENFPTPDDEAFRALLAWAAGVSDGGETPPPLDEREALFARTVLPTLRSLTCMNAGCHGADAAVPYRLDPGVDGSVGVATARFNYKASLTMLGLDGDPSQSRLLKKSLPLHDGGIVHKGGNDAFLMGRDDPRARAIERWACVERRARLGVDCDDDEQRSLEGFVFVRGPFAAEPAFDLDVFTPGTDLYLATFTGSDLAVGDVENLTSALHDEAADVRDPAVDENGRRVAFSMRTSLARGHEIFTLDLETREARQLTFDAEPLDGGHVVNNRDPTFSPDGRLWYVSSRASVLADRAGVLDGDLYELDLVTGETWRRTATPHVERKPVFLVVGEENGGEVLFTALRDVFPGARRAHSFRFPPGLASEYHQHFGVTAPENLSFDTRELPDGRYVVVLGDLDNAWTGGRLGILDRNFGPELPPDTASSLPFYAPPLVRLDDDAREKGTTATLYRDPVALPDGRLLVATSDAPVDLADGAAAFDLRIEVLTLGEDPRNRGATLTSRSVVVDEPGVGDFDPEPVYVRAPAPLASVQKWDPLKDTGFIKHQGMPIIDALLERLPPTGARSTRSDGRFVRLVETLPRGPLDHVEVPASETRFGLTGATALSLGPLSPARVLAELPLSSDGSFQAEVPVDVPFRLQMLDERGMAVGTPHNRWFSASGGQTIPQGATTSLPDVYSARCAACHGAIDGDPDHAFVEPDVLTTASLTLSRYRDQNPRFPLDPPRVGDDTRRAVDFVDDVQPLIVARCSGCHGGVTPAAALSLTAAPTLWYSDAYESLLAPGEGYVDAGHGGAYGSFLVEKLLGEELGSPRALAEAGARHPASDPLSDDELRTVLRWIDLGASYRGRTSP